MKCPKCGASLKHILTRQSVVVDQCVECNGIRLDAGEINFFVKDRKILEPYYKNGLTGAKAVMDLCPKCNVHMQSGKISDMKYEIEECPSCKGLWFDEHEFKKLNDSRLSERLVPMQYAPLKHKNSGKIPQLPSLGLTTTVVLGSMYALLFGLMVFLVESGKIPYAMGMPMVVLVIVIQFLLGPVLMDWSLRLWGSLTWIECDQLPRHLSQFIVNTCTQNKIPTPRIGIIHDGAPQAYTYGRTPSSARLVLSRGILEILTEEEAQSVVAHEIGHITHRDFIVMTLAQLVPLMLYHLYRIFYDLSRKRTSGRDNKGNQRFMMAAVIAYVAYIVAEYLVMFISRVREYWADRFSVETTKNPNALVRALTKIAYGLAAAPKLPGTDLASGSLEKKKMAVQALGIMSIGNSKEMALYSSQGDSVNNTDLKDIMRWDLWSPWAAYYELHSTHPLTAKRFNAIAAQAVHMGIEPDVVFDLKKPENYWDDFLMDVFILAMPILGAASAVWIKLKFFSTGIQSPYNFDLLVALILGLCAGGLLKTVLSYPGGSFLNHSIVSLLKKIKVSPIQSYPVSVQGKIIGRGEPGNVFSEDMVIRDTSGLIFLDYQHGISNWFFALFRMDRFMGKDVRVEGWYRRAPTPFLEVKKIFLNNDMYRSYTYYFKLLGWIALPIILIFLRFNFNQYK